MPKEAENHTLRLLQEMREENREFYNTMQAFREETGERLDGLEAAVSGLAYIVAQGRGEFESLQDRVERIERRLDLADSPTK